MPQVLALPGVRVVRLHGVDLDLHDPGHRALWVLVVRTVLAEEEG